MIKMTKKSDIEVDTQVMLLESPFGDPAHLREQERAADWLIAHADRAYEPLLEMMRKGTAGPAVIQLLPRFMRSESIPALEKALITKSEQIARAAAKALAQHVGPEGLEILKQVVQSPGPGAVIAAADALAILGNKETCLSLLAALTHTDHRARYHVVQAAGQIGCLTKDQLILISTNDPDENIRALAADLYDSA